MKRWIITALSLSVSVCAFGQDTSTAAHAEHQAAVQATLPPNWAKEALAKSSRHGEWVNLKNGSRTVSAFVVYPEVSHKATAVVVIHEIFGMSD